MNARGILNYYIACDLDEGILRYWPKEASDSIDRLLFSQNRDEMHLGRHLEGFAEESGIEMALAHASGDYAKALGDKVLVDLAHDGVGAQLGHRQCLHDVFDDVESGDMSADDYELWKASLRV